jgi:hypothetical protein
MLRQVAEDVLIHQSEFCQSNAVVVQGRAGVLLIAPGCTGDVDVLIPGYGSIGGVGQVRARIEQDRAYMQALRGPGAPGDPRVGPTAKDGWDWVASVHERQLQRIARRR